jgi:predicted metal-dependent peptidase
MNSTIIEQVSKTTIQLLLKEPFYGHFFTGLLKDVSPKVSTMAVGSTPNKMVKLYVNPTFWTEVLITPELRYGVLKHEILHIVLKHITSMKKYPNKRIFNIAADIVVNQFIERSQLPEGVVLLEQFLELKLESNKDVGYYYDKLLKAWNSIIDDNGNKHICERLADLMSNGGWAMDMHSLWEEEFEKMTESERKIIDSLINDIVGNVVNRVSTKTIGNLPLGLQEYIGKLIASLTPTVDWRRFLRIFASSSMRTYIKNTIRRPSKRYGTTPGIKIKNRQKILVAIDTSGSINNQDLKEFFGELYHIWRQKAEIFVVECDTEIHKTYFYKGIAPEEIHGRGGTDFNAPIRYANEKYHADAIIYFTDGYAPVPSTPSRKPILWLISTTGIKSDSDIWNDLPGRKIKMIEQ